MLRKKRMAAITFVRNFVLQGREIIESNNLYA